MPKGRRSNWQKARDVNTNGQSGEFGEKLVAKILGGKLSCDRELKVGERIRDYADVHNDEFGFRVEVKTFGNKRPFYVRQGQLRYYGRSSRVPLSISDTFYALVSYKSQTAQRTRGGRMRMNGSSQRNYSPLSHLPMKFDRIRFIAERTDEIYIFDRRLVLRFSRVFPLDRQPPLAGRRNGACLKLNRTEIRKRLRDAPIEELAETFRINAVEWMREIRTIDSIVTVDGHDHTVRCRLIIIMPKATYEAIAPAIRFRAPSGDA